MNLQLSFSSLFLVLVSGFCFRCCISFHVFSCLKYFSFVFFYPSVIFSFFHNHSRYKRSDPQKNQSCNPTHLRAGFLPNHPLRFKPSTPPKSRVPSPTDQTPPHVKEGRFCIPNTLPYFFVLLRKSLGFFEYKRPCVYLVPSTAVLFSLPSCMSESATCWTISLVAYDLASFPAFVSFSICSLIHPM